jgi:16S rRNA G966 N2-methylase RsmD
MAKKSKANSKKTPASSKPSSLIDTRVIYCGDNLDQLKKFPDGCVDLIYIDPPFNTGNDSFIYPDRFKEEKEDYELHQGAHHVLHALERDHLLNKSCINLLNKLRGLDQELSVPLAAEAALRSLFKPDK